MITYIIDGIQKKKNNYKYDRKIRYKQVQWWENGFIKYSRSPNRKKNERIWS